MSGGQFFGRLASAAQRWAVWCVGLWVLVAVALTVVAPSLEEVGVQDDADFLPADAPSQQADRLLRKLFPDDPERDAAIIVVARDGGLRPADHDWLRRWAQEIEQFDGVTEVRSVAGNPAMAQLLRSPDGAAELAIVDLEVAPFTTRGHSLVGALRDSVATAPEGVDAHVTGLAGLAADQADAVQASFDRTAIVTLLLVLAILVAVYRSAVAPLIPLLSILLAFLVARGVVGLLAERGLRVASLAETFMVLIVFGAGTDYCLFLVSRYREDLGAGETPAATVRRTGRVIGPVLTASAATVIVGFLAQLSAQFGLFRTMGPALAIAVAVALAAGLTLTPALLTIAGSKVFWPSSLAEVRNKPNTTSRRWQRVADAVRSRPAEMLLAGAVLLLIPAAGLGWFRQSFDLVRDLPASADARVGFEELEEHFPGGRLSPIYVVLADDEPMLTDTKTAAIDRLTERLRDMPGVAEVRSVTQPAGAPITADLAAQFAGSGNGTAFGLDPNTTDVTPLYNAMASEQGLRFDATTLATYPQIREAVGPFFLGTDGNSTRLLVSLAGNPYDPSAKQVFHDLDDVTAATLAGSALGGSSLAIGGPASFYVDIQDIGATDTRTMAVVLFGGIFIVLAILLRSVVAPFYLLATVLASFAATLGLTVFVFQGLLGEPGISFFVTPLLFIILVALGADYNIFIISRIREELGHGDDTEAAAAAGLVQTGRVITSAGLILAGTFAALLVAPLPNLRQMGFAVATGILIDTFIVRSMLVPAATVLLGKWAFWPGYQRDRGHRLRPAHVRLAGAGVGVFAATLILIGVTTSTATTITRISEEPGSQPPPAARPAATQAQLSAPAPAPAPGAEEPTAATPPSAPEAAHDATAVQAAPTAETPSPGAERTAPPPSIRPPSPGDWQFHIEGTRRIGVAGSTQPYSEDVITAVTRDGGTDEAPLFRLHTRTGGGEEEDRRRYSASAVELMGTRRASGGMGYGGTMDPPQQVLRLPAEVGATWESDWSTGTVDGRSTFRITAIRSVAVAGNRYDCVEVTSESTFSGEASGTQRQVACWVLEVGMIIASDDHFQGTFNGVPFEIHERRSLTAFP